MSSKTNIAWADSTWNVVTGCSKVSEGCRNCFAERMDKRIRGARGEEWKPWTAPNAEYNVRLHPERLNQPLVWKKPRRVFVNSMSDLFHEQVPFEFIGKVFYVMSKAERHTFQVLTKRPRRMLDFINWMNATSVSGPYDLAVDWSNVWLGVSVENQRAADERIPLLLQTPAAIRFLSCEPLLGPIEFDPLWLRTSPSTAFLDGKVTSDMPAWTREGCYGIDWIIVGGESGPNHREMNLDWARSLRDQCVAAHVPFFFKQGSGLRPATNPTLDGVEWHQYPSHT